MSERPGPSPEEMGISEENRQDPSADKGVPEGETLSETVRNNPILAENLENGLQRIKEGTSELEPVEALSLVLESALGIELVGDLELESYDYEEALGLAFTVLLENGIDDPEQFLKEKGILE